MSNGRFGIHGGQFIPETLMSAVAELETAYEHYKNDPQFTAELKYLLERSTLFAGQAPEAFRLHPYAKINREASKEELSLTRERVKSPTATGWMWQ